ncbi:GNAT family N-acetyltransferase [Paenibacillus woosongensis]|uniref:GNAT family N-acetyltransferase n=1 Tax=Paenibacillus woosongensis TaxID=307580 RepID=A0A7X3CM50_9BACL|nr:GNAT family N-acetyltransferase [Paenibacillus woosongensis]MUG43575.1 GNAT family N-acetyltransferase [Paenibacillus woosongensis]
MQVTIHLTDPKSKFIINNLYPFYLHDLSEIWGWQPNKYGVFEDDDAIMTLNEQNRVFDIWWSKPTILFPYLIEVNGVPAGFALVATPPYTPHESDFYINEFFILRSFRGGGAAEAAAIQVLNSHEGTWELQTNPGESNRRAQSFWRRTLNNYTGGDYQEEVAETKNDGTKLIFRFKNSDNQNK